MSDCPITDWEDELTTVTRERDRYKKALKEYAAHSNWASDDEGPQECNQFMRGKHGWELAEEALEPENLNPRGEGKL